MRYVMTSHLYEGGGFRKERVRANLQENNKKKFIPTKKKLVLEFLSYIKKEENSLPLHLSFIYERINCQISDLK